MRARVLGGIIVAATTLAGGRAFADDTSAAKSVALKVSVSFG